jgi:hypothetical protein
MQVRGLPAALIALGAGIVCLAGASASHAKSAEGTAPSINAKAAGNLSRATPAAAGTVLLKGEVVYLKRRCYTAAGRTAEPLAGATLTFDQPGQGPVTLDSKGGFRARLAARFPIHGWVVLDGKRLSVGPDVVGAAPYRIPLGALAHIENGRVAVVHRFEIAGAGPAGAANIWTVLNLAARVADSAAPGAVPKVKAGWRYLPNLIGWLGDTTDPTNWEKATKTIHVEGRHDGKRAEWEPFVLLHEYGHALLDSVASPGDFAAGEHSFTSVHKDQPALPWSEGFGDAFAAIVLKRADLELGCKPQVNLGATPATPLPDNQRLAQYNEIAVAGVVWGLVNHFGRGDPQAGLRPFLHALHSYERNGHPPQSARDMRDALIVGGLEKDSADEHIAIDKIFAAQRIAWGLYVHIEYVAHPDPNSNRVDANQVLAGPGAYSTCQFNFDTTVDQSYGPPEFPFDWTGIRVKGGLPYTWQSDCLLSGAYTYTDNNNGAADMWLRFPYLPGQAHRDTYVYSAELSCADTFDYKCPASYTVTVWVYNGVWGSLDQAYAIFPGQSWIRPEVLPGVIKSSVNVQMNVVTPLVRFNGSGDCTIIGTGQDCGV